MFTIEPTPNGFYAVRGNMKLGPAESSAKAYDLADRWTESEVASRGYATMTAKQKQRLAKRKAFGNVRESGLSA